MKAIDLILIILLAVILTLAFLGWGRLRKKGCGCGSADCTGSCAGCKGCGEKKTDGGLGICPDRRRHILPTAAFL